jgi:serine/threonine protein kinase
VHNDVKPANILIQNDVFKLTDFGLATAFGQQHSGGSLIFMPPQLARLAAANDEEFFSSGPACDFFGLAVVMALAVNGQVLERKDEPLAEQYDLVTPFSLGFAQPASDPLPAEVEATLFSLIRAMLDGAASSQHLDLAAGLQARCGDPRSFSRILSDRHEDPVSCVCICSIDSYFTNLRTNSWIQALRPSPSSRRPRRCRYLFHFRFFAVMD